MNSSLGLCLFVISNVPYADAATAPTVSSKIKNKIKFSKINLFNALVNKSKFQTKIGAYDVLPGFQFSGAPCSNCRDGKCYCIGEKGERVSVKQTFECFEFHIQNLIFKGPNGQIGLTGLTGLSGHSGAPGPDGEKGDRGFQGPQGLQGARGEKVSLFFCFCYLYLLFKKRILYREVLVHQAMKVHQVLLVFQVIQVNQAHQVMMDATEPK